MFRSFVRSTATFSLLMAILELVIRGPFAWQTYAFGAAAAIFLLMALMSTPRTMVRDTVIALAAYFVICTLFEVVGQVMMTGTRVAVFSFPVAATLLVGRRVAVGFFFAAVIQTIAVAAIATSPEAATHRPLDAVGAIFVGAILLLIANAFDNARKNAESLAADRERDLQKALAAAETAADTQSKFLANMSHEIRTPMNGVLGLSRLLAGEPLNASQRELAETVVSSGESLLHILDDILDLSKLNANALLLAPEKVRPERVGREVVALMNVRAQDRGTALALEVNDEVPTWVWLDGHRLRQVLTNLVGNAVKFTAHGEVMVRMSYLDGTLRCEVQDTGIGIDPERSEILFRPFIQADSGTARRYGGTGLGLAICKQLCELMNGRIGVQSQLGVGSTFWFEFPAPATERPEIGAEDTEVPLPKLKVLVAEDNRVNQMVIQRFLDRLSAEVVMVADGDQAVEAVQADDFDVVLMDRHMPGTDGLEAARRIRNLDSTVNRIPIVAITASVMAQDRAACMAAGMDAVLPKPVELTSLKQTLHAVAGR